MVADPRFLVVDVGPVSDPDRSAYCVANLKGRSTEELRDAQARSTRARRIGARRPRRLVAFELDAEFVRAWRENRP